MFDKLTVALNCSGEKRDYDLCRQLRGDAYFTLGCAYGVYVSGHRGASDDQTQKAKKYLNEAIKYDPGNADYHRNLALAYAEDGDMDECKRMLEAAVNCAKQDPLYRPLVSRDRLEKLFASLSEEHFQNVLKLLDSLYPCD